MAIDPARGDLTSVAAVFIAGASVPCLSLALFDLPLIALPLWEAVGLIAALFVPSAALGTVTYHLRLAKVCRTSRASGWAWASRGSPTQAAW